MIRLDMNYLIQLIKTLAEIPHIKKQLFFFNNNSLYKLPENYRFVEYSLNKDNSRSYQLSSIDKTELIDKIIELAKDGVKIEVLIDLIVTNENVTRELAEEFIAEMISSTFLISELEPKLTGQDPLFELIKKFKELNGVNKYLKILTSAFKLICHPIHEISYYTNISNILKQLSLNTESQDSNQLQVDLFLKFSEAKINDSLINCILQQAEDLMALAKNSSSRSLEEFKNRFFNKYEEAEISLSIALDVDMGIGYAGIYEESSFANELIENLNYLNENGRLEDSSSNLQQFIYKKYDDYQWNNHLCIEIEQKDLQDLRASQRNDINFPMSLYLMGSLMMKNHSLTPEHFEFEISSFGGPSAGNLMGRFANGDSEICRRTKEILEHEELENPDVIYAEIIHLPEPRVGNILLKPLLRQYEIPYVGKSGAPVERQIDIDDLFISIRNNQIILRSKRLNKRIIPRLTAAHNFSHNSLPVYKFLCDLQNQGLFYPLVWDWGVLSDFKHLPRVTYKNLIIRKASWKIKETDIEDLPKDESSYKEYFTKFRKKFKIPMRVLYVEGDNKLLIDFESEIGIKLFLHYLKRTHTLLLEEFLFSKENCIVKDKQNRVYTNELIIPLFFRKSNSLKSIPLNNEVKLTGKRRLFSLNSEWLYFKIYCGSKTADRILKQKILPFVEYGYKSELFEKFFFVRYKDDNSHLRLRFYNTDITKQPHLQEMFLNTINPLIETNIINRVVADTYIRELERYGDELIEVTEYIFSHDSLSLLRIMNELEESDGETMRVMIAMRSIDFLLEDFNLSLTDKSNFISGIGKAFLKEFKGGSSLQNPLNQKYRQNKTVILSFMNQKNDKVNEIESIIRLFQDRSQILSGFVNIIKLKFKMEQDNQRYFHLLSKYIHMHINRFFIVNQRKYEAVIYHFLERYYSSLERRHAIVENDL